MVKSGEFYITEYNEIWFIEKENNFIVSCYMVNGSVTYSTFNDSIKINKISYWYKQPMPSDFIECIYRSWYGGT